MPAQYRLVELSDCNYVCQNIEASMFSFSSGTFPNGDPFYGIIVGGRYSGRITGSDIPYGRSLTSILCWAWDYFK